MEREFTPDGIEHETLPRPGTYDDPSVHFAVNCASIGCPMLREEAYAADRLDAPLEEQTRRFLSDRSRNRHAGDRLEVSMIFTSFQGGLDERLPRLRREIRAAPVPGAILARYAVLLARDPGHQDLIRQQKAEIRRLDYDWSLNDARK